ncbi:hypothetical protein GCM10023189_56410 [Nibrella saemangeumensis]|uniref:Endonuclease n=1 Tax=Nibrella saemangeumensis TaxID=1084526 RepID=A0ABP8NLR1_9BACT
MFFRPFHRSSRRYHQRGFRLRGNTLVLLFIFFLIGLFLHYGGRTEPVVAFWNDVKSLVGIRSSRPERKEDNPYKAPEPTEEVATDVASDDRTAAEKPKRRSRKSRPSSDNVASDNSPSGSDGTSMPGTRFAFEKEVDFILPAFKASDQIIRHDGYALRYQEQYEQADWVAYPLLAYEVTGDAERGNDFMPDREVATGSAMPGDYTRSGYDRGHLAPAGDFKFSQRLMKESFYMSNMSPQAPQFNRGIWKQLEDQVRDWAVRDQGLYVVTGPVLKPDLPTIGKQNQIAVPEYYYKVLLYCNSPKIRMIAFVLRNEGSDRPLREFVVPVSEVERRTGIKFFPKIPADIAQKLKNQRPAQMIQAWF